MLEMTGLEMHGVHREKELAEEKGTAITDRAMSRIHLDRILER